jgi:hypothetical protein
MINKFIKVVALFLKCFQAQVIAFFNIQMTIAFLLILPFYPHRQLCWYVEPI